MLSPEEFKALRASKGLTQKQLAELVGTTQTTITNIEKGVTRHPNVDIAMKIAATLGKDVYELFGDATHRSNYSCEELESKLQKLSIESKKNEELAILYKEKYKGLYLKFIERDFLDYMEMVDEIYEAIRTFDSEEQKIKFEKQLQAEKEYLRGKISELFKEGIFSEFEILDILYQNDPNMTLIIESDGQDPVKITEYWSDYMDISQSKVEQFLIWFNKKWGNFRKWNRSVR